MTSFAAAYLIVWGAVALYVLRLRTAHQELAQRLDQLQSNVEAVDPPDERPLAA